MAAGRHSLGAVTRTYISASATRLGGQGWGRKRENTTRNVMGFFKPLRSEHQRILLMRTSGSLSDSSASPVLCSDDEYP